MSTPKWKNAQYATEKEKYAAYRKLPAHLKLEWLEKMNRFLYYFMPPESRRIAERYRKNSLR